MTAPQQIPAAELSELIGAIYDCSLDPQRWAATCRKIAQRCDSAGGGICVHDLKQIQNDQLYVFGYEPEFLQKFGARYAESPMAAADVLSNAGDVSALSMERFHLHDSAFYREVLQPHGVLDIIWFPALRTGGRMASLHASRSGESLHYQQSDLALFELLAPHVCRALAISDALDIQVLSSEVLKRTLDGLAAGVFLAARDGRVVYMNTAAERQVRSGTAMRLIDNRLSPVHPAARAALTQAIQDSGREGADMRTKDHAIGIPGGTGGATSPPCCRLPMAGAPGSSHRSRRALRCSSRTLSRRR